MLGPGVFLAEEELNSRFAWFPCICFSLQLKAKKVEIYCVVKTSNGENTSTRVAESLLGRGIQARAGMWV